MERQYLLRCSECPNTFEAARADAKTCSTNCRGKRSRRLKRNKQAGGKAGALPPGQAQVTEIIRGEVADAARPLVEEELRPVVREAITEDTLRAISRMVALTPAAVSALEEDLQSDNATHRQRAAKLVLQYTVGHPAVVRPDDADPHNQLVVNFTLPRPQVQPDDVDGELAEEDTRDCVVCHKTKGLSQFVANSDRCGDCHAELLGLAQGYLDQQAKDSTVE